MPIRQMLKDTYAFDPDRVVQLTAAFEDALQKMGSVNRDDPAALAVARHIIELAKQGETDTGAIVRRRHSALVRERRLKPGAVPCLPKTWDGMRGTGPRPAGARPGRSRCRGWKAGCANPMSWIPIKARSPA